MTSHTKIKQGKKEVLSQVKPKSTFKERIIRFISIVLVPIAIIIIFEVLLRLFGYGTSTKFVFKEKVNGELCYVPNDDFTVKYFGRDMGRTSAAFAIPVRKKQNTFRIFLMGSSAAEGDPAPAYSMSEFLKVFLHSKYPGVHFEIINVGMTAINSHVVYDIAKECSKLDPDMFIIYEGNNEVVGPFGPGTVFSPLLSNIKLIRTLAFLKGTRIGQFYSEIISSVSNKPKEWGGMEMFLNKKVYASNKDLQKVYNHFECNLNDICAIAKKKNIPVIISSVGINLKDCAPFEGKPAGLTPAKAEKILQIQELGQKLYSIGKYQESVDMYTEALLVDSLSANIWFRIADSYYKLGKYAAARACYNKSMDLDALRFRADTRINQILNKFSTDNENNNIFFAPSEDSLIARSQQGIMGHDLFYDHVHLRFEGNYIVAKALYTTLSNIPYFRKYKVTEDLPTIADCEMDLGFTGWDKYKLWQDVISRYSRPPFTNQIDHEVTIQFLQDELKREEINTKAESFPAIIASYEKSIKSDSANWMIHLRYADFLQEGPLNFTQAEKELMNVNKFISHPSISSELGNVAVKEGDYAKAINYYKKVVDKIPGSAAAYGNLALSYFLSGNDEKALQNYNKALQLNQNYKNVHFGIAALYLRAGKYVQALTENKKEVKINIYMPQVYEQLGQIYEKLDSMEKASQAYELAFQLDPYNVDYNKERAEILSKLGRYEESVVHYKFVALKSDTNVRANIDCGNALTRAGDFKSAIYFYSKAVRLDPKNYACYNNLGNIYLQLQKTDSSIYFYKKAIELKNSLPGFHVNLGMAYLSDSKPEKALESLNNALLLDSNFYAAHVSKGMVYEFEAKPELAISEYKKATLIEPGNGVAFKKLGLILIKKSDYENAIQISNKAHELMPMDSNVTDMLSLVYFKYGNYYYNQHQYTNAISRLEKAVQFDPDNSNPKIALAWAYYKEAQVEFSQKNSIEGLTALQNAVKVFPDFIEANYNLGVTLLQLNRSQEAFKYIKQVYLANPKYFEVSSIYNDLKKRINN